MAAPKPIQVGDPAPDFALPTAAGQEIRLADLRGHELILFFYPKDGTPGCTVEACAFRDSHEAFVAAGARVVGVSSDDEASHRRFAGRLNLPFDLVSDTTGELRALYGVPRTLGLLPGRVTFLIDRDGIVRHRFSSQLQPGKHVAEMLAELRRLQDERGGSGGTHVS